MKCANCGCDDAIKGADDVSAPIQRNPLETREENMSVTTDPTFDPTFDVLIAAWQRDLGTMWQRDLGTPDAPKINFRYPPRQAQDEMATLRVRLQHAVRSRDGAEAAYHEYANIIGGLNHRIAMVERDPA